MWLWPWFIYTNDQEVRVLNRPTIKYQLHYINIPQNRSRQASMMLFV